jgi:hypothetical protein
VKKQYPIVEQRSLAPAPKAKWLGPKPTRTAAEIPAGRTDHRLVYRVDGDYISDNFALALNSPTVLAASHVSLIDVSRNAPIIAEFEIPSRDAGAFTVRATFLCTVTDPIAVAQEGPADLTATLEAYLKSHYPFEEIGRSHDLGEINDVRCMINARAEAFTTFVPPKVAGVQMKFASAQVLEPGDRKNFYDTFREENFRAKLDQLQQHNAQQLQSDHGQFERGEATLQQTHRNNLRAQQLQDDLEAYRATAETVPGNAHDFGLFAVAKGDISAREFFGEVRQMQQVNAEYEHDRHRQKWEAARADHDTEFRAKLNLVSELINRGHSDTMALRGLEAAIDTLLGAADRDDRDEPARRAVQSPATEALDDPTIVEVREEDGF